MKSHDGKSCGSLMMSWAPLAIICNFSFYHFTSKSCKLIAKVIYSKWLWLISRTNFGQNFTSNHFKTNKIGEMEIYMDTNLNPSLQQSSIIMLTVKCMSTDSALTARQCHDNYCFNSL